jgi:hypothetical protein
LCEGGYVIVYKWYKEEIDQMNIVNEKVEHVKFGFGVITEEKNNKIWVQFQDEIKTKAFLYPDIFEVFLKAVNPTVEKDVLEELRRKQEQIELELEQKEKEREAARLEEIQAKLELKKTKPKAR